MSTQNSLNFDSVTFSPDVAQRLKERGQALAENSRKVVFAAAQACAVYLSMKNANGEVDIDQVYMQLAKMGFSPSDLGNAAGSVFKGWKHVGYKKSERVSRHRGVVAIWRRA